jgi:hypothetical protein
MARLTDFHRQHIGISYVASYALNTYIDTIVDQHTCSGDGAYVFQWSAALVLF